MQRSLRSSPGPAGPLNMSNHIPPSLCIGDSLGGLATTEFFPSGTLFGLVSRSLEGEWLPRRAVRRNSATAGRSILVIDLRRSVLRVSPGSFALLTSSFL